MNILLTGAHGTGKTSTARAVNAKRPDLQLLPSASRQSPHKPGTVENQKHIMSEVWRRVNSPGPAIHERTPLDVYAYTALLDVGCEVAQQRAMVDEFYRVMRDAGCPLFYFPICFDLEIDGVRPGKWEQIAVDRTIAASLKASGIEYHTVPDASVDIRAAFILERVSHE